MRIQTLIISIFISTSLFSQENTKTFLVLDSSQYDSNFIKYWEHVKNYGVIFSKDSIIIEGDKSNAVIIPTDLPLEQNVTYKAIQGDTTYILVVNRLNYTNIYFLIIGTKNNKTVFERKDTAILESSFHLGSEGVYEKSENEIYGMNDYNISDGNNHKLLIPVGTIEAINYYEPGKHKEIVLLFKKIE